MNKTIFIVLFLMVCGVCYGADVNRQNIKPTAEYTADGDTFFMVNMICAEENTVLPNVKNNHFIRSNIRNCILDGSNTFDRSIYTPEQPEVIEEPTVEELDARVKQLEKFITDNSLEVPAKAVSIE